MTSLPLTSLVTLLVVLLMFVTALNVGRARGRYGIKAPATTGHEMFDRAFRVQMNTLESAAIMLPALWLFAGFVSDPVAGILGTLWLIARVWYAIAYQNDPAKRSGGFGLSFLVFVGLWLGALWSVVKVILH
ncbi:MAG: MAPEG family protein [Sterolibacterium sp.]|nr:MAPEG family protein [Sterolibacterium sp.]